jgi:hypothetical protein
MGHSAFDDVWAGVRSLSPEEMRRLRDLLDAALTVPGATQTREDQLDALLLSAGLMHRIPAPVADAGPYQRWQPVEVQGKPLSESIIEERR